MQAIVPSRGYRFSSVKYLLPSVCIIYSTFRNQNNTCIIRYFCLVRQTTDPNRFIEEFIWSYSPNGITVGGQSRKLRECISNHECEAMKETGTGQDQALYPVYASFSNAVFPKCSEPHSPTALLTRNSCSDTR